MPDPVDSPIAAAMAAARALNGKQPADEAPKPVFDVRSAEHRAAAIAKAGLAPPSPSQLTALDKLFTMPHRTIKLQAPAGYGKSHVLNCGKACADIFMCATTARAGLLVGGTTADRVFGFSRKTWTIRSYNQVRAVMESLPRRIAIDEDSQVGFKMASLIKEVADRYGKQLILSGDWAQASPVMDQWGITHPLFRDAEWCKLTEPHRQSDPLYLEALSLLRVGQVTPLVEDVFSQACRDLDDVDSSWTHGLATNALVTQHNLSEYRKLPANAAELELVASFEDLRPIARQEQFPYDDVARQQIIGEEVRMAMGHTFKCGCRIICTMNDPMGRWVNGDTGVLVDALLTRDRVLSDEKPVKSSWDPRLSNRDVVYLLIRLDRVDHNGEPLLVDMPIMLYSNKDVSGQPEWAVSGFPIRHGWAQTLHSLQGTTLDRLVLDMASICHFPEGDARHGLAYVGLSRTRTLGGLRIRGWRPSAVHCSEIIRPYV